MPHQRSLTSVAEVVSGRHFINVLSTVVYPICFVLGCCARVEGDGGGGWCRRRV